MGNLTAEEQALLALASDPETDPMLLEDLVRTQGGCGLHRVRMEVLFAVAVNPNTPSEALRTCVSYAYSHEGEMLFEAVARNPAVPLLALEEPDGWAASLLKDEEVPF